jgi:RNA-binding protein NOB1
VTKLSKVTGDYTSLSAVDIQLIALAYQLTKEKLGPDAHRLKTELTADSVQKVTVLGAGGQNFEEKPVGKEEEGKVKIETEIENVEKDSLDEDAEEDSGEGSDDDEDNGSLEEEEDDDEEGWITPSNYKQKIKEMSAADGQQEPDQNTVVACLTNDFSMQVR